MGRSGSIKAIETEYAGCRFRSRLEARWAVLFDHLEVSWEYEPEGLELDGVRYLPDFRIPSMGGMYVEVKGCATARDMKKIAAVAKAGERILVVGSIPRSEDLGPNFFLFDSDGYFLRRWTVSLFQANSGDFSPIPFGWPLLTRFDRLGDAEYEALAGHENNIEGLSGFVIPSDIVGPAFQAARSARFEHGESG